MTRSILTYKRRGRRAQQASINILLIYRDNWDISAMAQFVYCGCRVDWMIIIFCGKPWRLAIFLNSLGISDFPAARQLYTFMKMLRSWCAFLLNWFCDGRNVEKSRSWAKFLVSKCAVAIKLADVYKLYIYMIIYILLYIFIWCITKTKLLVHNVSAG